MILDSSHSLFWTVVPIIFGRFFLWPYGGGCHTPKHRNSMSNINIYDDLVWFRLDDLYPAPGVVGQSGGFLPHPRILCTFGPLNAP